MQGNISKNNKRRRQPNQRIKREKRNLKLENISMVNGRLLRAPPN
jgi:hypothetical protein